MEMNEVEDPAAFQEKLEPVYDEYRDAIGADLVDQAMSELGRN